MMFRFDTANYPGGQYVALYDGEGDLDFGFDATVVSRAPGRVVVQATPAAQGVLLEITRSVSGNHSRWW